MTLIEFLKLLEALGVPVFHYEADNTDYPYMVFTEREKSYATADDICTESYWHVQVDFFTYAEFDPVADEIERLLNDAHMLSRWMVSYEYETKTIHHVFECEVPCDDEYDDD